MELLLLKQWVGSERLVSTETLTSDGPTFIFSVDFVTNPRYILRGIVAAASDGMAASAAIVVNADRSANYATYAVSMVDDPSSYNAQSELTNTLAKIGPGYGNSGDFGQSEQVQYEINLIKTATGLVIFSHTNTNGSGAGDTHYFNTVWTGATEITEITIASNLIPLAGSSFIAGSRFDVYLPNDGTLWAT